MFEEIRNKMHVLETRKCVHGKTDKTDQIIHFQ